MSDSLSLSLSLYIYIYIYIYIYMRVIQIVLSLTQILDVSYSSNFALPEKKLRQKSDLFFPILRSGSQ